MIGAWGSITILSAIAFLHVYWAFGGRSGMGIAVPERNGRAAFSPTPAQTALVAAFFFFAAVLVAMRAGLMPSAELGWFPRFAAWALVMIFALRAIGDFRLIGFFKRREDGRFARLDTVFYSPLCVLTALLIADVARR